MNYFKVSYSKQAEADLDRIYNFIANEYHNLNSAVKLLRRLTKVIDDLSFMADSYHHFQEEPFLSEGINIVYSIRFLMILHISLELFLAQWIY